MKAVLISIQPKWCELIASGKKTVEVRKTKPKIDVPFKCYIYETKGKLRWCNKCQDTDCERPYPNCACWEGQGKVIGEFVCDRITEYECSSDGFGELATTCGTCLTYDEILNYCNGNDLYGWHITDLVIYDKPKELSEFKQIKIIRGYHKEGETKIEKLLKGSRIEVKYLTRPPQSWCYVEEGADNEQREAD